MFYDLSGFTEDDLIGLIHHQLYLLGMIERSEDYRCLRATPMAGTVIDDNKEMPVIRVIAIKEKPLIIHNNLECLVPFNVHVSVLKSLSAFADLAVLDRMVHFKITRESLVRGVDAGWDKDSIINYLDSISSSPVPQAVAYFISSTAGGIRYSLHRRYQV